PHRRGRAAEELDALRDELGPVTLLAVLPLPRAGLEPADDVGKAAFAEILVTGFRELVPSDDAEPLRFFLGLAVRPGPAAGDGDAERRDGRAVRGVAQLGIAAQVAQDGDLLKSRHRILLSAPARGG